MSSSLGLFPIATSTKLCDLGTKKSKFCCFIKERKEKRNVIRACMAPTTNLGHDEFPGTNFFLLLVILLYISYILGFVNGQVTTLPK